MSTAIIHDSPEYSVNPRVDCDRESCEKVFLNTTTSAQIAAVTAQGEKLNGHATDDRPTTDRSFVRNVFRTVIACASYFAVVSDNLTKLLN